MHHDAGMMVRRKIIMSHTPGPQRVEGG
jgi:hypothetical protein